MSSIDNQTVIRTKADHITLQPSIKRWFKHGFYLKNSKRMFNLEQQEQIAQAITQAEDGHHGEIQVIIEGSLPSDYAYHHDTLQRAHALFAKYRIWDTERNSGLLIYLNLCAHRVELVADRGINQAVTQASWNDICQDMVGYFKEDKFTEGLCSGITALGEILQKFYEHDQDDLSGNELANMPRLL